MSWALSVRLRDAAQPTPSVVGDRAADAVRSLGDRFLLSARERETVELLLYGYRVPAIARRLFISEHTVRNHLKAVFRKVGVSSQSELVELTRTR